MTDANASARYAAQRAVLDNILNEEGVDSLEVQELAVRRLKPIVAQEIGRLFIESEDIQADHMRQAYYALETLIEIATRVVREKRDLEGRAP